VLNIWHNGLPLEQRHTGPRIVSGMGAPINTQAFSKRVTRKLFREYRFKKGF